ncbi:hypothetical protein JOY44_25070 (plasmid) [Phormidium sp. CLA17]|uniref:hypothetical protein n=1 Tax=Leptolyngbya sp. Cla-17 TaxID=2803751 RepID=UPI0014915139|nr:hypothetical protein [Leptolyngbya sp. Cla-17]MBM0744801.1 hypothetical protein [Leptolyngbya sp. Cla-17]
MRLGQWLGLLPLLASLYVLWQVRSVVFLFFAAVLFAIALNRLVRRLQKLGANRRAAIALAIALT